MGFDDDRPLLALTIYPRSVTAYFGPTEVGSWSLVDQGRNISFTTGEQGVYSFKLDCTFGQLTLTVTKKAE